MTQYKVHPEKAHYKFFPYACPRHFLNHCASLPVEKNEAVLTFQGLSYDHVELGFFINGEKIEQPIIGIKGTVYPVIYVDEGAILDVLFSSFNYKPPEGFDMIMVEKELL